MARPGVLQIIRDFVEITNEAMEDGFVWSELASASRHDRLVAQRRLIANNLRDRGWSLNMIGEILGGRDHTTVMNLLGLVKQEHKTDRARRAQNAAITTKLRNMPRSCLSESEIAAWLGVTEKQIHSEIQAIREKLRRRLSDDPYIIEWIKESVKC